MKKLFATMMALLWFETANHCFVTAAFATPSAPTHHCCDESGKKLPLGTHDQNSSKACCQLFSQNAKISPDLASPTVVLNRSVLAAILTPELMLKAVHSVSYLPYFHSPPGDLKSFLVSLTLASNAPPSSL